jgi:hypothetical protein
VVVGTAGMIWLGEVEVVVGSVGMTEVIVGKDSALNSTQPPLDC